MRRRRLLVVLLLVFLELLSEISANAINKMIPKQSPAKLPGDPPRTAIAFKNTDIVSGSYKEESTILKDILTAPVNLARSQRDGNKTNPAIHVDSANRMVQRVARTTGRLTGTGHERWTP